MLGNGIRPVWNRYVLCSRKGVDTPGIDPSAAMRNYIISQNVSRFQSG